MSSLKGGTLVRPAIWLVGLLLGVSSNVAAEHLPIKTYTTADGLPRDAINRIARDSHGFLWFCTGDGLSRFDGYEFKTYGTEQGFISAKLRCNRVKNHEVTFP
jgi:ligand-binding sensor domain-containing protein